LRLGREEHVVEEHGDRQRARVAPWLDNSVIAALYSEFSAEDRDLAEEGMADYEQNLRMEDVE
jgi:hypothetical protein